MNMSSTPKTHKKHAGHPPKASAQAPTVRFLALIRNSAKGLVCSLGVALLFLLMTTALVTKAEDPSLLLYPSALTILYIAALLCGAITVRFSRDIPWLCGVTAGCMLLLACMLLGCFIIAPDTQSYPGALLTRVPIPLFSLLGAVSAGKRPRKSPRRKR